MNIREQEEGGVGHGVRIEHRHPPRQIARKQDKIGHGADSAAPTADFKIMGDFFGVAKHAAQRIHEEDHLRISGFIPPLKMEVPGEYESKKKGAEMTPRLF